MIAATRSGRPSLALVLAGDVSAEDGPPPWVAEITQSLDVDIALTTVRLGPEFGARVASAIAAASSSQVLVVHAANPPHGPVVDRMWRERSGAGLVLARIGSGTPGAAPGHRRRGGRGSRLVVRATERALSLPVRPDATLVLARREALAAGSSASGWFEWLAETIVIATADGWPVLRLDDDPGAPPDARIRVSWLRRLWVLRNSAFSADYDERAFNSVIPLQRYWQRERYRLITSFVDPGTRILDVGCGSSRIVQALPRAVGLDIQLKKLRRIAGVTRRLVQATLTSLPFRDAAFDTLICSQVIEHVPEPLVNWREFNRVLADGGTLVVGTPDYATFTWPLLESLYAIVHPRGYVNEHINRYTAASLRRALEAHGFSITDTAYVGGGELIYRAKKTRRA